MVTSSLDKRHNSTIFTTGQMDNLAQARPFMKSYFYNLAIELLSKNSTYLTYN